MFSVYLCHSLPVTEKMVKKVKKDITLREHLGMIQSDGGKARWAKLTPEERSAQARKIVAARWAKRAAETAPSTDSSSKSSKRASKKKPGKK
jgi:hypothetical protein